MVLTAGATGGEHGARVLVDSLASMGFEPVYLGAEDNARRIAAAVAEHTVDAVELIVGRQAGAVPLLRALLRELIEVGRRDVCIVLHRLH